MSPRTSSATQSGDAVPATAVKPPRARRTVAGTGRRGGKSTDDLATLLDDLTVYLARYLRLPSDGDYTAMALWAAHTYVIDAARTTPYLALSAGSGAAKTGVLEVLATIVRNPWHVISVTPATLYRTISEMEPTMLLDELDTAFGGDPEAAQALRGVINAGNRRGVKVPRMAGSGSEMRVEYHGTFCAKALAGIGAFPATIATRSIVVGMQWVSRHAVVEFHPIDAEPVAAELRARLDRWASAETLAALAPARATIVPEEIEDGRTAQLWTPLVAIADLAGKAWPGKVRAAILDRHGADGETREAQEPGRVLDAAIRDAFDRGIVRASGSNNSKQMPPYIGAMSDGPSWGWHGINPFRRIAVWHDSKSCTAELRLTRKDWTSFYGKVRAAINFEQRALLPVDPDDALKVLKQTGRLHTSGRNLTMCVAVYSSVRGAREPVVRLNISEWCWPNGQDTEPEEMP